MPDFNKGDFTQQGVDGHVRATLRLNEKRYVELDLTTNENARGCTISGNVHDRLNNLDYPIGAAPSGNIEITENGENINVTPYATATVNVSGGGGDIPLCTITFVPATPTAIDSYLNEDRTHVVPAAYNNGIVDNTPLSETISTDTVLSFMYNKVITPFPPNDPVYCVLLLNEDTTFTTSDEVNCTCEYGQITVTDESLPSSITVTLGTK